MTATDADIPLSSLLFPKGAAAASGPLADGVRRAAASNTASWPTAQWHQLGDAVGDQFMAACPGTLGSVLLQCWSDLHALREAADPAQTPPGATCTVTLATHDIEWATHPDLVVSVGGVRAFDVSYTVTLRLEIGFAALTVRDGRIREIGLGNCRGEASIECASTVIFRQPLGEAQFPGRLRFAEGIPIGRGYAAAGAQR
jgi:hypothetical protein